MLAEEDQQDADDSPPEPLPPAHEKRGAYEFAFFPHFDREFFYLVLDL